MNPSQMREAFAENFGIAMPWKEARQESPVTFTDVERGTMVSFTEKPKQTRALELLLVLGAVSAAVYFAGKEIEKRVD